MAKYYDQKCYELARAFLSDIPDLDSETGRDALAKEIQTVIEDWINQPPEYAKHPASSDMPALPRGQGSLTTYLQLSE